MSNGRGERIQWIHSHYVFVTKEGPFAESAPAAWGEAHRKLGNLKEQASAFASLFRLQPRQLYRAGVFLPADPVRLPDGMAYELLPQAPYLRFEHRGSYAGLGPAWGRVMAEIKSIPLRDDFFIEHYVSNPETTKEEDLVTHLLVPVAR